MTPTLRPLVLGAALFSALLATGAQADEPRYNQISLRAEVSREVPRDRMQVMLYTESQGQDPAALASDTTKTLNAALEQARKVAGVDVSLAIATLTRSTKTRAAPSMPGASAANCVWKAPTSLPCPS